MIGRKQLDAMGHMNVRHYMAIFDETSWSLFASFGMERTYYEAGVGGSFALKQSVRYLAECRVGEMVTVRGRLIGRSANGKRVHFMLFMLNESKGTLAATLETLVAHADMTIRRMSPFPPPILAQIDALIAQSEGLGWAAPVCGVIRP